MNVDSVKSSYVKHSRVKNQKSEHAPSFGAAAAAGKTLDGEIMNLLSKTTKKFMEWEKGGGEIFNTMVTAIGTAIVAPIFIVFNPLASEDKETRIYSAWRQPISAVIAILFQVSVNLGFNKILDFAASSGKWGFANLSAEPKDCYLERQIRQENKNLTDDQVKAEIKNRKKAAYDNALEKAKAKYANTRPDYAKDLVSTQAFEEAQKVVEAKLPNDLEFQKSIKGLSKKEIEAKIDEKILAEASVAVRKELNNAAQQKLYMKEISNKDGFYEAAKKELSEVTKLVEEGKISQITKEKFPHVYDSLSVKLDSLKNNHITIERLKASVKKHFELLDVAQYDYMQKGKDAAKKIKNTFAEILKDEEIIKSVDVGIKRMSQRFGNYKKFYGILISLITLPFSCGLLNWAYPRIMEKIMPETAKAKRDKYQTMALPSQPVGGNK